MTFETVELLIFMPMGRSDLLLANEDSVVGFFYCEHFDCFSFWQTVTMYNAPLTVVHLLSSMDVRFAIVKVEQPLLLATLLLVSSCICYDTTCL